MKITICGSIAFFREMLQIKNKLEKINHQVKMPPTHIPDQNGNMISVEQYYKIRKAENNDQSWIWQEKEKAMRDHFDKVEWADAVLILNYSKRNVENYIGANTLLEMGLAFHLEKKIYLLNKIPEISYKEEILGMRPIVIDNDLTKI
jgi:nucleoside 2-deoxyribosyltransferase